MKEEVKRWINQAKTDLNTSQNSFKSRDYYACNFWCQQSVEKALKAVLLSKTRKIIKVHDLNILAKKVNLPTSLMGLCKELTIVYIQTRYPDIPHLNNQFEKSDKYISFAKEVLKWAEKNI